MVSSAPKERPKAITPNRLALQLEFMRGAFGVTKILALALPLWVVQSCVKEMAGKDTRFAIGIGGTLILGGTGFAAIVGVLKFFSQKSEVKRLRERVNDLERELAAAKGKATVGAKK